MQLVTEITDLWTIIDFKMKVRFMIISQSIHNLALRTISLILILKRRPYSLLANCNSSNKYPFSEIIFLIDNKPIQCYQKWSNLSNFIHKIK